MFVYVDEELAFAALPCVGYDDSAFLASEGMLYVAELIECRRFDATERVSQLAAAVRRTDSHILAGGHEAVGDRGDISPSQDVTVCGRAPPPLSDTRIRDGPTGRMTCTFIGCPHRIRLDPLIAHRRRECGYRAVCLQEVPNTHPQQLHELAARSMIVASGTSAPTTVGRLRAALNPGGTSYVSVMSMSYTLVGNTTRPCCVTRTGGPLVLGSGTSLSCVHSARTRANRSGNAAAANAPADLLECGRRSTHIPLPVRFRPLSGGES